MYYITYHQLTKKERNIHTTNNVHKAVVILVHTQG